MNTKPNTCLQPMLFPDMEHNDHGKYNYQIKRLDDSSFSVPLLVAGEADPEIQALEYLGYFVVPEIFIQ